MKEIAKKEDNSCGVVSVVLGIVGIVLSSLIGVVLGIIGLLFGIKQKKYTPQNKWAKAGIILNIISIILGIVAFLVVTYLVASNLLSNLDVLSQVK